MSASIFDTIAPKMLQRIQSLRLMDDDFMTVVFGGTMKLRSFCFESFWSVMIYTLQGL